LGHRRLSIGPEAGQREKGCAPPRPGDTCRENAKAPASEKRTPRQHRLCRRETGLRKRLRARPSCLLCGDARCGAICVRYVRTNRRRFDSPPIERENTEYMMYTHVSFHKKIRIMRRRIVSPGSFYMRVCLSTSLNTPHTGDGNFTRKLTHTNAAPAVNLMVHQAESDPTKSAYAMRAALNN